MGSGQGKGEPIAMNDQRILEELLSLLEGQGVTIRHEPLGGTGGGLCAVRGSNQFFVDTEATSAETAARCAEAAGKVHTLLLYSRNSSLPTVEGRPAGTWLIGL